MTSLIDLVVHGSTSTFTLVQSSGLCPLVLFYWRAEAAIITRIVLSSWIRVAGVTMPEGLSVKEVQAFAEMFPGPTSAAPIMASVGLHLGMQPSWAGLSAEIWWWEVSQLLANGKIRDGRRHLLEKAREKFPFHSIFTNADGERSLSEVWNVPPQLARFIGRDGYLAELAESLAAEPVVALTGLGGVGKTALAVEYVYRHREEYDTIWWVSAEPGENIPSYLADLSEALNLSPAAEPAAIFAELRRRAKPWLLVFDNAEDLTALAPFRPTDRWGRILVTSRRTGWRGLGVMIEVSTLERPESVSVLTGRLPNVDQNLANRVAELLGDLALALEQGAAFCDQTGTPLSVMADLLTERLEDMIQEGDVADRPGVTVATLWELSTSRLAMTAPAAVELLELLALCSPEPLPLDLFEDRADLMGHNALAAAVGDRLTWTQAVGALVGYSLIRRNSSAVQVHRMVQAATRRRISSERRVESLGIWLRLLRADLPDEVQSSPQAWPRWSALLPHVQTVLQWTPDPMSRSDGDRQNITANSDDLAWLCARVAIYLHEHGRAGQALPVSQRLLKIAENGYGPDHPQVASALNNLASVLQDVGRTPEALPLYRRAVMIGETIYGSDDVEIAATLNGLASALQDLGRPAEALELFQRALNINSTVNDVGGHQMATALNNFALTLQDLGRSAEALPLFQRALALSEEIHGIKHPQVALRLNNLALVLADLGRPVEALPMLQRALVITENTFGPDHPRIAITINNLASVLRDLGRLVEALPQLERALMINEIAHGPEHPQTATSLTNLALTLEDLGRPAEALPIAERAAVVAEAAYGPDHPQLGIALNGLASALGDLSRFAEALPLLERASTIIETAYGPDHPKTAIALSNFAMMLKNIGRITEAVSVGERAVAISEAAYGPGHPQVAATSRNLASMLRELGNPTEALQLLQRALSVLENSPDPSHSDIAGTLTSMASTLQDLNLVSEALPLLKRALAIREAVDGSNHPQVATVLNNMALALRNLGRPSDALPLLQRAYRITESIYGRDHTESAIQLNNVAMTLRDLGRSDDALPLLEEALRVSESIYGPDHFKVATTLNNIALILGDLGRAADALPLLRRALTIAESVYGALHPATTTIRRNLADASAVEDR